MTSHKTETLIKVNNEQELILRRRSYREWDLFSFLKEGTEKYVETGNTYYES